MKKSILNIAIIFLAAFYSCNQGKKNNTQSEESGHNHSEMNEGHDHQKNKKPLSPVKTVMKLIGDTHIHIEYGAPSVRGRVVWGGLVAFDKVWSTGAHKVTSVDINKDFLINGYTIPAGKYALFTMPGKEEWTIILNKIWDQHLADDYEAVEDILRWNVRPKTLSQSVEQLTFAIAAEGENSAIISFQWDKASVEFKIEFK